MKKYPSEMYAYTDPVTGASVKRLTSYRGNSNHLYFTNNCFYDNGKKIVFESDRDNAQNLFSLDLESGEIEQLTDLPVKPYPEEPALHEAFVDPVFDRCAFFADGKLFVIDLKTKEVRPIYELPEGHFHHIISISCDGKHVLTSIYTADDTVLKGDRSLRAIWKSDPTSKILRIDIETGECEVVYEEKSFIAHVNASPTDKDILTFCHEGPWAEVDHRLWILDMKDPTPKKLHPCKPGECIGHEFWFADGSRVGYHGHDNGEKILGSLTTSGEDDRTYAFPFNTGHIFSLDGKLIVGDGGSASSVYLRLWTFEDGTYSEPVALCRHACSFKRQRAHVHPRITDDGRSVLYTSDETGYEQIYLVTIPGDLKKLPPLSKVSKV